MHAATHVTDLASSSGLPGGITRAERTKTSDITCHLHGGPQRLEVETYPAAAASYREWRG